MKKIIATFSAIILVTLLFGCAKDAPYEKNTYTATTIVTNIDLGEIHSDIEIRQTTDMLCKVDYYTNKYDSYEFTINNSTLYISAVCEHNVFKTQINKHEKTVIYLPLAFFGNIKIDANAGNITLDEKISARDLNISTNAGNVNVRGSYDAVSAYVNAGNIYFGGLKSGNISASTNVGNITGTINGNKDDYSITATTVVGESNLTDSVGKKYTLTLSTDVGNISVSFI